MRTGANEVLTAGLASVAQQEHLLCSATESPCIETDDFTHNARLVVRWHRQLLGRVPFIACAVDVELGAAAVAAEDIDRHRVANGETRQFLALAIWTSDDDGLGIAPGHDRSR
jgi:hypothetical protein